MTLRSETIIMSQTVIANLEIVNGIEFTFTIRRHHVFKTTCYSVISEKLDYKEDDREEALSCDKYANLRLPKHSHFELSYSKFFESSYSKIVKRPILN